MGKMLNMNQKRTNKHSKTKKKQPLKVVYITNPIKFKTSASEFRALVQELTGQDAADALEISVGGGGEAVEDVKEKNEGQSRNCEAVERGFDSSGPGSGNDVWVYPDMMGGLSGLVGSNLLDVLDAM